MGQRTEDKRRAAGLCLRCGAAPRPGFLMCGSCAAHHNACSNRRYHAYWHKYQSDYELQQNYGITEAQYRKLLAQQSGCCAICRTTKPNGRGRRFYVDHDHETGKIRGLLCHSCNTALGMFKDDDAVIQRAVWYLRRRLLRVVV